MRQEKPPQDRILDYLTESDAYVLKAIERALEDIKSTLTGLEGSAVDAVHSPQRHE